MEHNFREELYGHFNNMRSYALNDESALLMASYPRGGRPESPFPYFNEVMTGFEYCAGTHLLYEGMEDAGLTVVRGIRDRYDGKRRSPFNEAECGHHYARAMAAWTGILAWTGFQYEAAAGDLVFVREGFFFWSTGDAWGTIDIAPDQACIQVVEGVLNLRSLRVADWGFAETDRAVRLAAGDQRQLPLRRS
jgi:hypothetical protein